MAAGRRSNGRIVILLAIVLILGLGAVAFLFRDQIMPQPEVVQPTQAPQEKMVDIVITTQFVARGTQLTESVLTTVPYPEKNLVQDTFYTDMGQIVGKQAKYDLEARVPLTSSLIVDKPVGSNAAFQIPKGMVAIALPISRLSAVSYAPQVGDHINIIVSLLLTDVDPNFQSRLPNYTGSVIAPGPGSGSSEKSNGNPSMAAQITAGGPESKQGRVELDPTLNQAVYVVPSEEQRPRVVSQTLIQDAIVLHVGDFLSGDSNAPARAANPAADAAAAPTPGPADGEQQPQAQPTAKPVPQDITLVVSPQDAVTLNYLLMYVSSADKKGGANFSLALRSAGDTDKVRTEAVTLQFLLDQYNIPNPAKLPYAIEPPVLNLLPPSVPTPTPVAPPPQQ